MATKFDLYFDGKPPQVSGTYIVQTDTTGAAANFNWVTALASASATPKGPVWLELEALTAAAYVRFKGTNAAAGTTAANGAILPVGVPKRFFVSPGTLPYIDHFCATAGSIKVQVVSQPFGRDEQ